MPALTWQPSLQLSLFNTMSASSSSCAPRSADDVRQLYLEFCRVSKTLQDPEELECARLAEALKECLVRRARDLLDHCQGGAVLYTYGSDATSYVCQAVKVASLGAQGSVLRRGRVLNEFLMQRGHLFCRLPDGREFLAPLFKDPVPLSLGKKTANLFQAAVEFLPTLRRQGFRGLIVNHFVADRAVFSSLDLRLRQRHRAYYEPELGPELGDEAGLLMLSDLYCSCGCSAHDIQNSLRWGLTAHATAEDLKDMHIICESLRNSFSILHGHLYSFLRSSLMFDHTLVDAEAVCKFWQCLGVPADMLELFVEVNPWFEDGTLWVSGSLEGMPDLLDKVSGVIVFAWRWRRFVDSRWCSIGASSRSVVASLVLGLESIVAATRADEACTDYHLHGFGRISAPIKKYMILAAITSVVADGVLLEVLQDDRLLRRSTEVQQALADELSWVESIGTFVWGRLARLVGAGVTGHGLRGDCLASANIVAAYIRRKVFQEMEQYPWRLAVGDVDENLEVLQASNDTISDPFAASVRGLLRVGLPPEKVKQAVLLLRECPWSTVHVEQSHGSLGVLHRFHPSYTPQTLCTRAMLHQARHLFTKSADEKRIEKQIDRVDALRLRHRGNISARHAFMGGLMREVKAGMPAGSKMSPELRTEVMKQHGRLYELLSPHQKVTWEREAAVMSERKHAAVEDDLRHESDALQLQVMRREQELEELGVNMHSDAARLSDTDLEAIGTFLQSDALGRSEVSKRRSSALAPPAAPSDAALRALDSCPTSAGPKPAKEKPPWLAPLCNLRGVLQGSILMSNVQAEGSPAYLVLYAMQSPHQANFLRLRRCSQALPALGALAPADVEAVWDRWYDHRFVYTPGDTITESDVPLRSLGEVFVVHFASFLESGVVGADGELEAFSAFLDAHQVKAPKQEAKRATAPPAAGDVEDLLVKFPWAEEYTRQAKGGDGSAPDGASGSGAASSGDGRNAEDLTERQVEEAWEALANKRAGFEQPGGLVDFCCAIRGGAWTAANKGVAADVVVAQALRSARAWCKTYKLNVESSYSFAKHGEREASYLAKEWASRQQHFYDLWVHRGGDSNFEYSDEDLASYVESPAWLNFVSGLSSGPTLARAQAIRALLPQSRA